MVKRKKKVNRADERKRYFVVVAGEKHNGRQACPFVMCVVPGDDQRIARTQKPVAGRSPSLLFFFLWLLPFLLDLPVWSSFSRASCSLGAIWVWSCWSKEREGYKKFFFRSVTSKSCVQVAIGTIGIHEKREREKKALWIFTFFSCLTLGCVCSSVVVYDCVRPPPSYIPVISRHWCVPSQTLFVFFCRLLLGSVWNFLFFFLV